MDLWTFTLVGGQFPNFVGGREADLDPSATASGRKIPHAVQRRHGPFSFRNFGYQGLELSRRR